MLIPFVPQFSSLIFRHFDSPELRLLTAQQVFVLLDLSPKCPMNRRVPSGENLIKCGHHLVSFPSFKSHVPSCFRLLSSGIKHLYLKFCLELVIFIVRRVFLLWVSPSLSEPEPYQLSVWHSLKELNVKSKKGKWYWSRI